MSGERAAPRTKRATTQEDAMSRNTNPFAFPGPITLDNLDQLFAHHRSLTGGYGMDASGAGQGGGQSAGQTGTQGAGQGGQPADRPEGVSEEEWTALGDPGRAAIIRERQARQEAERRLAAAQARPAPPGGSQGDGQAGGGQGGQNGQNGNGNQGAGQGGQQGAPDIAAIVQQAVADAVKPFQEAEERRRVDEAAGKVRAAVLEAAGARLHDPTDALGNVDLTQVVDGNGAVDPAKVAAALDALVSKKPHLAKSGQRYAPPGIGGGAPAGANEADKVKAALAQMNEAAGLRVTAAAGTTN